MKKNLNLPHIEKDIDNQNASTDMTIMPINKGINAQVISMLQIQASMAEI